MALLTKDQTRAAVRQAIDDPSGNRWSDTNLDILITMVEDVLWQAINDTFPWFLSQTDVSATNPSGVIAISALTKRFYRIQKLTLTSSGAEYQPRLANETFAQATYYMLGASISTDPIVISSNMNVAYSYMPTRFIDLALGSTQLTDFPEGHESALVYLAAAWAISKGDAESLAQISRIADQAIESLLTHIARRYPVSAMNAVPMAKMAIMRTAGLT